MHRHRLIVYCLLSAGAAPDARYYFGADLSYVNELEACGAEYSFQGKKRDPFFRATQCDMAWEWYFHDEALIGLSAYYKDVSCDIGWRQEPQTLDGISYAVSVLVNRNCGSVSGAEAAFQTPSSSGLRWGTAVCISDQRSITEEHSHGTR